MHNENLCIMTVIRMLERFLNKEKISHHSSFCGIVDDYVSSKGALELRSKRKGHMNARMCHQNVIVQYCHSLKRYIDSQFWVTVISMEKKESFQFMGSISEDPQSAFLQTQHLYRK